MIDLPKVYDHKQAEEKWYQIWGSKGYFSPNNSIDPFTIVIPPPNITGSLHMGHALDNTLQDILIRYKRMKGFNTLWIPGVDHAGIATQNVVEKELAKNNIKKEELGREKFLEKVWEWKEKYGNTITKQLRRLGSSLDWSRERFTMDEGLSKAVRKAFVSLYKEGLIYKGKRMVNWCPRCLSAISDIEVEHENKKGHLWYIKYPLEKAYKNIEFVVVATTRPETMLGDTAVAINPHDERYKHLAGLNIILPLVDRKIPIVADAFVEQSFGTGAVKVTPAHDPNDFEISKRHNLQKISMLSKNGKIDLSDFEKDEREKIKDYEGLDRFKAREKVIKELEEKGLLEKVEDYENAIGKCYRCKTVVEPCLSDQWFVKVAPLAEAAIRSVEKGDIKFEPSRWGKVYIDWMTNLKDWCISRQIWWGHRIPVWYCSCGEIIASETDPTECPKCKNSSLVQDSDVLDTWFSSSLWPFSTLGWPNETEDLKTFYPTSVLITGYDIITFWVSKMIMMGLKFMHKEPFKIVYIHGLIRDITGKKMSKSLGNVIDPLDIIEHAGADALRFALTSLSTSGGQDLKLSEEKITEGRNFANKIWNLSRFVLMQGNVENEEINFGDLDLAQKWILSKYNKTVQKITDLLDNLEFGESARLLYEFIWSDFCDWFVEITKSEISLSQSSKMQSTLPFTLYPLPKEKTQSPLIRNQNTLNILKHILKGTLKLLHPFMPFETEEIYQHIKNLNDTESIMISKWPVPNIELINDEIESEMETVKEVIKTIRNIRAEMNIPYSKEINVLISAKSKKSLIEGAIPYIKNLTKAYGVTVEHEISGIQDKSASAAFKDIEIYIPLVGLIDFNKEKERLKKSYDELEILINKISAKLTDEKFVLHAKPELVEAEKSKLKEYLDKKNILLERIKTLSD